MTKIVDQASGNNWKMYNGDCVKILGMLPDSYVDYQIFSPPFASLFVYSCDPRDFGNCASYEDFFEQYDHLTREQYRISAPGRLLSAHCMLLPTSKTKDGYIGLRDFRGDLIRAYQKAGWIYHSEVAIWKDPVVAVNRTKALGLLFKQLVKDSGMSRQGINDYVVTFRKPGDNANPVTKDPDEFPVERWQRYASPIWATLGESDDERFLRCSDTETSDPSSGIDPGDTLNFRAAREERDEAHLCPLQLGVIRRCIKLWTNPGDVVLSPFAGVGSEGHVALQEGRKFIGAELKPSYWRQAVKNLQSVANPSQQNLFK
jgi:hypothetical protein